MVLTFSDWHFTPLCAPRKKVCDCQSVLLSFFWGENVHFIGDHFQLIGGGGGEGDSLVLIVFQLVQKEQP